MSTSGSESRSGLVLELAEEFLERYRNGQRPPLREYIERHPELAGEIREVFPAMAMMERIAIADESLEGDLTGDAPAGRGRLPEQLGDYRILREIGRGGMGVVYEAEQVSLGRHVALKVLPAQMVGDEKTRRRFEREAKAAAKLHHTNIVPVFGVGEDGDTPYYVMQFIRGQGLDAVLAELKRLRAGDGGRAAGAVAPESPAPRDFTAADVARSLLTGQHIPGHPDPSVTEPAVPARGEENASGSRSASSLSLPGASPRGKSRRESYWQGIARIIYQAADALAYAHDQGIVHRDIKPSNLLLDAAGTVWITDFGLAKANDQQDLTHTGDILGTLRYLPPEAFGGKVDARGDIYSLGLTLYELLAFGPAFDEKDRGRLVRQVTNETPPPLRKRNSDVPRDLETIVQKAIERDPGHRYASAADLAEDLRRFVTDEPIRARRRSASERLVRWGRRNPLVAGLAAAVGALLLTIILGLDYAKNAAQSALKRETLLSRQASDRAAEAARARDASESARKEADAARLTLGDELYASRMTLMQTAFQANNIARAAALLDLERPRPGEPDRRGFEWHYWRRQANPERQAWWRPGAPSIQNSGETFSADGRLLARAETSDRRDELVLAVRDVESGQLRHRIRLDYQASIDGASVAIRISQDDARIAAVWRGDGVNTVRADLGVWDLASGKELLRRTAQQPARGLRRLGCYVALDASGNRVAWGYTVFAANSFGLATRIESSRLVVDEVASGMRHLDRTMVAPKWVRNVALTARGDRMVVTLIERTDPEANLDRSQIQVFDLPGGRQRNSIDLGDRFATAMQIDPMGRRVASARGPSPAAHLPDIQVRDLETGKLVWSRDWTIGTFVTRLDFTPDGDRLLVAGHQGFQVLDATAERPPLFEIRHPASNQIPAAQSARFTHGGRQVMDIVYEVTTQWDVPAPDSPLGGREYPDAETIAVSPAGDLVALNRPATEGQSPAILVMEAASGRVVRRIEYQPPGDIDRPTLFFSADGSRVGLLETVMRRHANTIFYHLDNVRVWEARSGRSIARFDVDALTHGEPEGLYWPVSTAISGDGSQLAIAMNGMEPDVGNSAVNGSETHSTGSTGHRMRLGKVVVADLASGTIVRTIRDDGRNALNLARAPLFSADGRFLIAMTVTDSAPAVCLWDLRQGGPPLVLPVDSNGRPEFLAISRDAKRILGARLAGRMWVIDAWDLSRPKDPPRQVSWPGAGFGGLTLSPDGTRLAILSGRHLQRGEVALWDANSFRELATWSTGSAVPYDAVFTPNGGRLLVSIRHETGTSRPALRVFDAEPLDPRLEAFALIQRLGAQEPLNRMLIEAIRAQTGYEPDVLREAERLAAERPEDPDTLLRALNVVPRLPVAHPKTKVEPWLAYTAEAARVAPGMPFAHTEHGRSLYALGRYTEAKEAYAKAIALDPQPAEPHAWLAFCEARLVRRAESLKSAARFLRNSRGATDRAGVEAMRSALTSMLREAFGPAVQEDLDRLTNPIMPNGPDAFAR